MGEQLKHVARDPSPWPYRILAALGLFICFFAQPLRGTTVERKGPVAEHQVLDVFVLGDLHVWMITLDEDRCYLFRTTDGGDTWSRVEVQPRIYKVFFLDQYSGWALSMTVREKEGGFRTHLLRTWDGGASWILLSELEAQSGTGEDELFVDFFFVDSLRGWFVAQGEMGGPRVLSTTDGGKCFKEVKLPVTELVSTLRIFSDRYEGLWIVGQNLILHSKDRGNTWELQMNPSNLPEGRREVMLNAGWAMGDGRGWAVGTGGIILITRNFGRTWKIQMKSRAVSFFTDVFFWDNVYGCAVGASLLLTCTDDGGETWNARAVLPVPEGKEADLFTRVAFLKSGRGWVVTNGGYLYQTEDGGETWHELDLVKATDTQQ